MRLTKLFVGPAILGLSACVPPDLPYKKLGVDMASAVGYSDFEMGNNKYKVMYSGARGNPPSTVMQYAYQRAKELCKEKGFNDYVTSNTEAGSQLAEFNADVGYVKNTSTYSLEVECKNK